LSDDEILHNLLALNLERTEIGQNPTLGSSPRKTLYIALARIWKVIS
jgi:hypothetical protein